MRNPILFAMNTKTMEMLITPPKGNLENVMQPGNRAVATRYQTPPHHRTHPLEPYPQLVDEWSVVVFIHHRLSSDFVCLGFARQVPIQGRLGNLQGEADFAGGILTITIE